MYCRLDPAVQLRGSSYGVNSHIRFSDGGILILCHVYEVPQARPNTIECHSLNALARLRIICSGFMPVSNIVCILVAGKFVRKWSGRLLNVHPSLLPSFKGINAHEQVLAAGVKVTGCTVHHVVVSRVTRCLLLAWTVLLSTLFRSR